MTLHVRDGGIWKETTGGNFHVRDGGIWKAASEGHVRDAGVWKKYYESINLGPIGVAMEGGFFAGYISHTANGVATHGLIVAPAASGYNGQVGLRWKTSNTSTAGTSSDFNGSVNSANMNNASHPAAQYCEGLTIGGYSD